MSIEDKIDALFVAIQANTAALSTLTAMLSAAKLITPPVEAPAAPKAEKVKVEKAKAEKPAPTPTAPETATTAQEASAAPAPAAESPSEGGTDEVTLEDVQNAAREKLADYKDEVKAVLATFGAAKVSQLYHKQFRAALEAIKAIGKTEDVL